MSLDPRFDDNYLYFFEVLHHEARNERQARFILENLALAPGAEVLDAPCGYGRIARLLANAGCRVTGVDANPEYIARARLEAGSFPNDCLAYHVGDMREIVWEANFDAVICWYISLGYYDDATDLEILRRFHRCLRPGGRLLVEHVHLPQYLRAFGERGPQVGFSRRGDDLMLLEVEYDLQESRSRVRRTVVREGRTSTCSFSLRLYSVAEFRNLLQAAGFLDIHAFGRDGAPLEMNHDRVFFNALR